MSAAVKVAVSDDFFYAFSKLTRDKQQGVMRFLAKFRQNPTASGLNYERVRQARDEGVHSVAAFHIHLGGQDGHNAVLQRELNHRSHFTFKFGQGRIVGSQTNQRNAGAMQAIFAGQRPFTSPAHFRIHPEGIKE